MILFSAIWTLIDQGFYLSAQDLALEQGDID